MAEIVERDKQKAVEQPSERGETVSPTSTALSLRNGYGVTDLSLMPTLFPAPVANLITALSTSARLSLRLSAFFIETILETSQLSTRLSLGYSRRLLITAISSARRIYLMSNAALEGDILGLMGLGEDKLAAFTGNDPFLQVLDKYTNLGVYIIHHTFTLAELFAMSGFYLTASAVQSAHFAAQESVALFDTLFGSNESSRALSSIITLVRKELLEDERFKAKDKGKIASLTALTKALTAFACIQNATWKEREAKLKIKTIYDYTVLEQDEMESASITGEDRKVSGVGNVESQRTTFESRVDIDQSSHHGHHPFPEAGPSRLRDHGSRVERPSRRKGGDVFEITDETTESTTITRSFTVQDLEQMGLKFEHKRGRSIPIQRKEYPTLPLPIQERRTSARKISGHLGDDAEWIEVNNEVFGDEDELEIPSIPNGSSTLATKSYREAVEYPDANSQRIQMILKTMTRKIMQRKRVVRRENDDLSISDAAGPSTPQADNTRRDVTSISWEPESIKAATSVITPATISTRSHSSELQASPTPTSKKRQYQDTSPSSTNTASLTKVDLPSQTASSSTSGSKILTKARNVFRPMSTKKRVSRPPSPEYHMVTSTTDQSSIASIAPSQTERSIAPPTRTPLSTSPTTNIPRVPPNTRHDQSPDKVKRKRKSFIPIKESVHTASSRMQSATTQILPKKEDTDSSASLYPHDTLIHNIHRFMRFSSAAYGQNFLRIFGMSSTDQTFPSTQQHHANSWSFAQHTGTPIDSLLLSSYTEKTPLSNQKAPPLIHYVAVDHKLKTVILTCRGTLGLSDVLIDLTCDYCPVDIEGGNEDEEYYAHSGMYQSAQSLTARQSKVHQTLVKALEDNPEYGLVLTGHSLGGGVAALLAIICAMPAEEFRATKKPSTTHPRITTPFVTSSKSGLPVGRPIHCYAYGPPAVTSPDLMKWSKGLITSVVHGSDIVPTLSLGVLRDLKNIALTLFEEGFAAEEIVGRVIGVYQRKFAFQQNDNSTRSILTDLIPGQRSSDDEQALADWMMSLIKTMRADMDNEKLYPPGQVYLIEYFDICLTIHENLRQATQRKSSEKKAKRVILRKCDSVEDRFREPLFTKTMLNDHLPLHYERSARLLVDGIAQSQM